MEESTKRKLHQIEIIAAFVLVFVSIISFFPNPGITGFVSVETKTQQLNLIIANSQSYILTTNSNVPFYLTSLKLTGEVIGDGLVKAYISTKNQKVLIYSNTVSKIGELGTITGMGKITGGVVGVNPQDAERGSLVINFLENIEGSPGEITKDEKIVGGPFTEKCVESCFIEMLLDKDTAYQLLFYVDEGTILEVGEIVYTTRTD